MSNVFKTQSLLTIVVETGYEGLSNATVKKILYVKPNGGEKGYFPGTVSGTKLTYPLANGDIDRAGVWQFQAYLEVGGLKAFGDITTHSFDRPII